MRIAIIGAGGVGGYLAVRLMQAGHDVAIMARGAHLSAIETDGLRLIGRKGASATVNPATLAAGSKDDSFDLVIFAVKTHQLEGAIEDASGLMAGHTLALPFQNGVDAPRLLAEAFGPVRTLIGIARIFANITAPGVITQYGPRADFVVGDYDGTQTSPGATAARKMLLDANVGSAERADVRVDLWSKFLLFNSVSGTTAAARTTMGTVRNTPLLWELFCDLAHETAAVGRAASIALPDNAVEKTLKIAASLPDESRASTAHDLEAGKPLEVEWVAGAVHRLGQELGVPTPRSSSIAAILSPFKDGSG